MLKARDARQKSRRRVINIRMKTKFWLAAGLSTMILAGGVFSVSKVSSAADARATFNSKCATCHGRDGRGQTRRGRRSHTRDLTAAAWQDDVSDERLFNSINNGRAKMPAFKKHLSENEMDALVAYVRRLRR
jgi:mono/diheme cytochrome c family protein